MTKGSSPVPALGTSLALGALFPSLLLPRRSEDLSHLLLLLQLLHHYHDGSAGHILYRVRIDDGYILVGAPIDDVALNLEDFVQM